MLWSKKKQFIGEGGEIAFENKVRVSDSTLEDNP